MNKNSLGTILLVIGFVIVILCLLTDIIGISKIIGIAGDPRFGLIQIAGIILGIILSGLGWYFMQKKLI